MALSDEGPRKAAAGVFLCSTSAISFEVALTRVFSISLFHHFAYMAISIGMLGMALGGTLQSVYASLRRPERLGLYALLLSASMPLGHVITNLLPFDPVELQWDRAQAGYLGVYYVLLALPFFFFGLVVSASLASYSGRSGLIYGADLLGAGLGAALVVGLIGLAGAEKAVVLASLPALAGAFLMGRRKSSILIALLMFSTVSAGGGLIKIRMSDYKELELALKYPGARRLTTYEDAFSRVDTFMSPLSRYAPGLSLGYLEDLPEQTGLTIDGSGISAITKAEEGWPEFLEHLPSALPYETGKRNSALVIDPGGGLGVAMARRYGVGLVESVESNPLVLDVVRGDFGDYSGRIYDKAAHAGLARNRLVKYKRYFDTIELSLTRALPIGSFGINEDYRYTEEAFATYLSSLSENGVLSINAYMLPPPRTELRLLLTAVMALEKAGNKEIGDHIAAIRSWGSICLLVKPAPFTGREIEHLKVFAYNNGFDLVYYPGIKKQETDTFIKSSAFDYHDAFVSLIRPETREGFVRDYVFDIREVKDDRPFFNYHLKLRNIKVIYELFGHKWQYFLTEGYLLPVILVQAALFSILILAPAFFSGRIRGEGAGGGLLYFAFLGLGFMFLEVPIIQKMILPFENPHRAFALVLAAILVFSGAGSLLCQRYEALRKPGVIAVLSLVAAAYAIALSAAPSWLSAWSMPVRLFASLILMLPGGLLMGMPFPLGIRAVGERSPGLIPWAWAVNGCFSVIAPLLAVLLAMSIGFRGVLALGAVSYALAFLTGSRALFK